jgi:hypothetical protein
VISEVESEVSIDFLVMRGTGLDRRMKINGGVELVFVRRTLWAHRQKLRTEAAGRGGPSGDEAAEACRGQT